MLYGSICQHWRVLKTTQQNQNQPAICNSNLAIKKPDDAAADADAEADDDDDEVLRHCRRGLQKSNIAQFPD